MPYQEYMYIKFLINFLVPFLVGMVVIPLLMKFSQKTGSLVDVPEGDALKIHKKSIPLLGGVAMSVSALVGFLLVWDKSLALVALAGAIIFFLGFYDDLKWKHISTIKPLLKFGLLIICTFVPAVILSLAGISFNFIPVSAISVLLGFIYIFVSINAVNYQDGIDGLAGGLVSISLAGFFYLGMAANVPLATVISLIFLGAVTAFLQFNYPPAKIFMGDSGAYSLGFVLTVLAMLFSKPYNFYSILGPLFIIGLPIVDGVFTNIRRLANGKSIFLGDRSHFYDKLLQKGFSTKKTLAICYCLQLLFVVAGVLMYQ